VRENREREENGAIAINAEIAKIAEQKNHSAISAISALASVSVCSQLD